MFSLCLNSMGMKKKSHHLLDYLLDIKFNPIITLCHCLQLTVNLFAGTIVDILKNVWKFKNLFYFMIKGTFWVKLSCIWCLKRKIVLKYFSLNWFLNIISIHATCSMGGDMDRVYNKIFHLEREEKRIHSFFPSALKCWELIAPKNSWNGFLKFTT